MSWPALTLADDKEYFTWIDAQGRIHNTPKPTVEKPAAASSTDQVSKAESDHQTVEPPRPSSTYLTEEEFKLEQERQARESPPFFTWIDAEGRLRNEPIPQGSSATETDVQAEDAWYDHTLLPGWRVSAAVRESGCCDSYRGHFRERLQAGKSVLFNRVFLSAPLITREGERPAWYFRIDLDKRTDPESVLRLRLRDTDAPMALIALDAELKPLHFIPQLQRHRVEATWKAVAFYESLISIADKDVRAFILYFPAGAQDRANLEVEYRP